MRTLIPKLRFPEFRRAPSWTVEPLGRLFSERQETGFPDLPLLSVTDRDGVIPQEETNRANNSNPDKKKYLRVVPGDIAYNTMRMWEGRSARAGLEGLVSPAYTVCKPEADTNSLFFAYYFKTQPLIEQFRRYSQGLVEDTLNLKYEAFSRIPIGFPDPVEQRKLGACLASLDELLAAEARKLEALQTHRKGLMQQLFPCEGECCPRLRFPEFRDAPGWQERRLGDFITETSDIASADIPLFSLTIDDGVTAKTERYERSFLVRDESDAYKVVQRDDFAFNPMNLRFGAIARHSGQHPVALSKYYNIFRCDASVDSSFCHIYFRGDVMVTLYDRIATGTLIEKRRVHFDRFLKLEIRFPNLAEQQRIAASLSSLDALIAAQSRKLDGLRVHKKGLMQQLFPLPERE